MLYFSYIIWEVNYMDYSSSFSANYQSSPLTIVLSIALTVLVVIAEWKIFEKAGEPGWKCLIPLYNAYILFKITWGNGWKFLLLLIPIANVVIAIITQVKLAKAFGKGGGFAVGLVLLPVIFYPILGFGDAQYIGVPQN